MAEGISSEDIDDFLDNDDIDTEDVKELSDEEFKAEVQLRLSEEYKKTIHKSW